MAQVRKVAKARGKRSAFCSRGLLLSIGSRKDNGGIEVGGRPKHTTDAQGGFEMLPVFPVAVGVAGENDEEQRDQELAGSRVPEELGAGDEGHDEG